MGRDLQCTWTEREMTASRDTPVERQGFYTTIPTMNLLLRVLYSSKPWYVCRIMRPVHRVSHATRLTSTPAQASVSARVDLNRFPLLFKINLHKSRFFFKTQSNWQISSIRLTRLRTTSSPPTPQPPFFKHLFLLPVRVHMYRTTKLSRLWSFWFVHHEKGDRLRSYKTTVKMRITW